MAIDPSLPRVEVYSLRVNFDHYLDRVEKGETFIITEHGKDVAVLMPAAEYEALIDGIEHHEQQPDSES